MKLLKALSVPKVITVFCLVALGINGLVQVELQRDMSSKARQLKDRISETEQLSGQMKAGLSGLTELRDTSRHMASTLDSLSQTTSEMNDGLATLEMTVEGIGGAVERIGGSTESAGVKVKSAQLTAKQLLEILQTVYSVNGEVIGSLNRMVQDQKRINDNLSEMNRKTAVLPQLGGAG